MNRLLFVTGAFSAAATSVQLTHTSGTCNGEDCSSNTTDDSSFPAAVRTRRSLSGALLEMVGEKQTASREDVVRPPHCVTSGGWTIVIDAWGLEVESPHMPLSVAVAVHCTCEALIANVLLLSVLVPFVDKIVSPSH